MMSAQRDWRQRLPRLLIRRSAQRLRPLLGCSTASAPVFLVLDVAT